MSGNKETSHGASRGLSRTVIVGGGLRAPSACDFIIAQEASAAMSIIQDTTITILPANGDLPAVCVPSLNPEEKRQPLALALAACITGQGGEDGPPSAPLSSLVRSGYVASLRFERYLLVRAPRAAKFLGSVCNGFRIALIRTFCFSFHCRGVYGQLVRRLVSKRAGNHSATENNSLNSHT